MVFTNRLNFYKDFAIVLHLALSYELYVCLLESKQVVAKTMSELSNDSLAKVLPPLKDFIEKYCAHDQVF